VVAHGGLEDGEGAGGELVFFDARDFVLARGKGSGWTVDKEAGGCEGAEEGVRELVARLLQEFPVDSDQLWS